SARPFGDWRHYLPSNHGFILPARG
ncbi:MAG: hypothetical protein JWR00_2198, partial [Rubritepida sp.]|nr:hypothetical protein [Rubritepida sp.]